MKPMIYRPRVSVDDHGAVRVHTDDGRSRPIGWAMYGDGDTASADTLAAAVENARSALAEHAEDDDVVLYRERRDAEDVADRDAAVRRRDGVVADAHTVADIVGRGDDVDDVDVDGRLPRPSDVLEITADVAVDIVVGLGGPTEWVRVIFNAYGDVTRCEWHTTATPSSRRTHVVEIHDDDVDVVLSMYGHDRASVWYVGRSSLADADANY